MKYINSTVIPATNDHAKSIKLQWISIDLDEYLHFLGIFLCMEIFEIHGPRRLYWNEEENLLFPGMNYGKIVTRTRFEELAKYMQLSFDKDDGKQILAFLEVVNNQFQSSLAPVSHITLDESMIKSYHRNLKGKMRIIRKPRPTGSEIKNLSDPASNIVLNMELYEGKDIMAAKDYVRTFGSAIATTLRSTQPYHGTGKRVIADSWFSSVKSAAELLKRGLYSIMLVETAHKQFPRQLLGENNLERGDWVAYTATIDEVKVQACCFRYLKVKDFVSTCSTAIPGNPHKTKHNGFVSSPKVAEDYLKNSASIDVHNHYGTGS